MSVIETVWWCPCTQLPAKVLAMDVKFPFVVIATAAKEQGVHVYNLQGGPKPFKVRWRG